MAMNDIEAILDKEAQRLVELVTELGGMQPGSVVRTFVGEDGTMSIQVVKLEDWLKKDDDDAD